MKTRFLVLLSLVALTSAMTGGTASVGIAQADQTATRTVVYKQVKPVAIPCGQDARVVQQLYTPPTRATTYRVSFTARGVGRVLFHIAPYYHWHMEPVNSPGGETQYTFDLTTQAIPILPNTLLLDGLPAACSIYSGDLIVSNVQIQAVPYHQALTPDF